MRFILRATRDQILQYYGPSHVTKIAISKKIGIWKKQRIISHRMRSLPSRLTRRKMVFTRNWNVLLPTWIPIWNDGSVQTILERKWDLCTDVPMDPSIVMTKLWSSLWHKTMWVNKQSPSLSNHSISDLPKYLCFTNIIRWCERIWRR